MASATPPGYPAKDDAPAKPAGADLCEAGGRGGSLGARIVCTARAASPEVQHPAVLFLLEPCCGAQGPRRKATPAPHLTRKACSEARPAY